MASHKNDKIIKDLFEKFDLDPQEDLFEKRMANGKLQYRIIPRKGIDKIEAMSKAKVTFEIVKCDIDHVVLLFKAQKFDDDGNLIETVFTTGEADRDNVKQKPAYLAAMAEARGRSRVILKIEGFYKYGIYSEVEAEEFQEFAKTKTATGGKTSEIKGDIESKGVEIPASLSKF
jgi:hypothetical protein